MLQMITEFIWQGKKFGVRCTLNFWLKSLPHTGSRKSSHLTMSPSDQACNRMSIKHCKIMPRPFAMFAQLSVPTWRDLMKNYKSPSTFQIWSGGTGAQSCSSSWWTSDIPPQSSTDDKSSHQNIVACISLSLGSRCQTAHSYDNLRKAKEYTVKPHKATPFDIRQGDQVFLFQKSGAQTSWPQNMTPDPLKSKGGRHWALNVPQGRHDCTGIYPWSRK